MFTVNWVALILKLTAISSGILNLLREIKLIFIQQRLKLLQHSFFNISFTLGAFQSSISKFVFSSEEFGFLAIIIILDWSQG